MARKRRIRWDRIAVVFLPLLLLIMLLITHCRHKDQEPDNSSLSDPADMLSLTAEDSDVQQTLAESDLFVIVIDPGHGGDDGGTTDGGTRFEKDDNLRLANAVNTALQEYQDIQVIMTRDTDVFISLEERCEIANKAEADVFVSLHRNSATEGNGIEIWVNNEDNSSDKRLAGYIMELLEDVGISKNRGIKSGFRSTNDGDNYYVNYYTDMPSCLIEMGFLTADIDNQYFDEHLTEYAEAIATGIIEYGTDLGLYETKT